MSDETRNDPMPLGDILEKVREGCEMYMNQLDNDGYCSESDDYVVALAFFEDYIEKIKQENEGPRITAQEPRNMAIPAPKSWVCTRLVKFLPWVLGNTKAV